MFFTHQTVTKQSETYVLLKVVIPIYLLIFYIYIYIIFRINTHRELQPFQAEAIVILLVCCPFSVQCILVQIAHWVFAVFEAVR